MLLYSPDDRFAADHSPDHLSTDPKSSFHDEAPVEPYLEKP
jgi:hypothetical protein